jgi:hypothetical protein
MLTLPGVGHSATRFLMILGLVAPLLPLIGSPAAAGDTAVERATLRGLRAVAVVVEDLGRLEGRAGLSQTTLRAAVEEQLSRAGIDVVPAPKEAPGFVYLYVRIRGLRGSVYPIWAVMQEYALKQGVVLARDTKIISVGATWSKHAISLFTDDALSRLRTDIEKGVDEFIGVYRSVNSEK